MITLFDGCRQERGSVRALRSESFRDHTANQDQGNDGESAASWGKWLWRRRPARTRIRVGSQREHAPGRGGDSRTGAERCTRIAIGGIWRRKARYRPAHSPNVATRIETFSIIAVFDSEGGRSLPFA